MSLVTTDIPPEELNPETPIHTLSVLVNNKAGVLMRICQVFARRGYNIDSLVVSEGRDKQFARMTIGISGDPAGLEQIILQVTDHRSLRRKNCRPNTDIHDRYDQW